MSAVTGLVGLGGGAGGTSFQGPSAAQITNPTNAQQIGTAYTGTQGSLTQQQQLLQALQGQNGIGNQSQVYNQLQGVVNGTGPNPAQAMLNQQTGQNVAQQAALMAGQRGAASNVGLIARQAAQQGAATQQQAVGQGASLQAQQSLNALGAAGTLASNQVSNQIGATSTNTQAQLAEQQALLNAQSQYNSQQVASQASVNAANASMANTQMQGQQGFIGGVLNGAGAVLASAQGGEVHKMADGGGMDISSLSTAPAAPITISAPTTQGPQSSFGKFLSGMGGSMGGGSSGSPGMQPSGAPQSGAMALNQGVSSAIQGISKKLKGPGPTEDEDFDSYAKGGMARDFRGGGNVKAKNGKEKATVSGNSYANDKIPAVLSEGEVVIPRSVMQSSDPIRNSASFVQQVLAKRKRSA